MFSVRAKAQELRRISHMRQSMVAIITRHSSWAHTTIGSDEGSDLRSRISNSETIVHKPETVPWKARHVARFPYCVTRD